MSNDKIIPVEGVNLNLSPLWLGPRKASLIKNLDISSLNNSKDQGNTLVFKPLSSNEIYDPNFPMPEGQNLTIGGGVCHDTNETVIFTWNNLTNFLISRIKNGIREKIFLGPEPEFNLDPANFINPDGRFFAQRVCIGTETKTYLYWTDGRTRHHFLCIEDSIATNSFDPVLFPYFAGPWDRRDFISLEIETPLDCIGITPVQTDKQGLNLVKERTWRFRLSYIDVYGRVSEQGNLSDLYYPPECLGDKVNCLDLNFTAGGPLWNKIRVEVQRNCSTGWEIVGILDKYEPCDKPWYERKINPALQYNPLTNRITWRYCSGKDCIPVPASEVARVENPAPDTSQTLFPLAGALAFGNNEYGKQPFDCSLKDAISFEVEKPAPDADTDNTTRNITVWVSINNRFLDNKSTGLWRKDDRVVFGGLGGGGREEDGIIGDYGMFFGDVQQEGFIGYLIGPSNLAAISRQYMFVPDNPLPFPLPGQPGEWVDHGVATSKDELREHEWLQKFEFKNLPPGKYIFRLANHHAKLTDANYQRTSTYVAGTGSFSGSDNNHANANLVTNDREVLIDVCDGDYDSIVSKSCLIIDDITYPKTNTSTERRTRCVEGYAWETKVNGDGSIPIEAAPVVTSASGGGVRRVYTTDHNGFYYIAAKDGSYYVKIFTRKDCQFQEIRTFRTPRSPGISKEDFFATDKWPKYLEELCNRVKVRGKVIDCTTGAGIPGVTVTLTNGATILTNDFGNFEIVAHDSETPRNEKLVFSAAGKCRLLTCDNQRCFPLVQYHQLPCTVCQERIFNMPDYQLKIVTVNLSGLQKGGRYAFALNGSDWKGGGGQFAQTDERWILDMPTENETKSFSYSKIRCRIPRAGWPLWMKRLHIRFSKNLAYDDFLTWVVDRFEFIDNTGLVNTVSPTQIKIHYASLNEFNKQYNFSTNVTWQVIDEKDSLRIEDRVHFVANGDGKIFDKTIVEQIRLDRDGSFFLIDYTPDLADLKEGAYIKFMRPAECASADIYYEVCKTVNIVAGIAQETEFIVNAYDSYLQGRQIPTPIVQTVKKTKVVQDSNPIVYEEVEESQTVNIIKPYSWSFEHHSPSDFWGTKCTNRGRPLPKNPTESILCKRSELALTGVLGTNGIVNYHHYFDDARKTIFVEQTFGGIINGIPQNNRILIICENDHFVVPFDDNTVRMVDGRAVLISADDQFGKPMVKTGENFGCQNEDRNTISHHGGVVLFFDSIRNVLVKHDFQSAKDISSDKAEKYFTLKGKAIRAANRDAKLKRYWHGRINPKDNQYYISDFDLNKLVYINDAPNHDIVNNDTLCFDITDESLRKSTSFIGEYYLILQGDEKENQFFSFKNGVAYSHYRPNNNSFNNFFGVQCTPAMKVAFAAKENEDSKEFLSVKVYSDKVLLYGKEVATERGQVSRIPRNKFDRGNNFWLGPFLCNEQSVQDPNLGKEVTTNSLFGGDKLAGKWVTVLFVGDPERLSEYFELVGFDFSYRKDDVV